MTEIAKIALIGREVGFVVMLLQREEKTQISNSDNFDNAVVARQVIAKITKAVEKNKKAGTK